MRTTFFEMGLLHDSYFMNSQSFIWNGKEWGESKRELARERKRKRESVCVAEKGLQHGS